MQRQRHAGPTGGPMGRAGLGSLPCELVIARYNEDISWSRNFANCTLTTVYDKGEPLPKRQLQEAAGPLARSTQLPNVGREAHTYLHHIVTHYDRLASTTIFFQGGIKLGSSSGSDSLDPPERYMRNGINTFHARRANVLQMGSGVGYEWQHHRHHPHQENQTTEGRLRHRHRSARTTRSDQWSNRAWATYLAHTEGQAAPLGGASSHTLGSFAEKVLRRNLSNPNARWVPRAFFSVGRNIIHRNPRRYYQRILQKSNLSHFIDPEEGHFMERAWMSIFFSCWRHWCPQLYTPGG